MSAAAPSAHMSGMEHTTDPRVQAVLTQNPQLKFIGAGSIADVLDAAEATRCLAPAPRESSFRLPRIARRVLTAYKTAAHG